MTDSKSGARARRVLRNATTSGVKIQEMLAASVDVIARRTAMGVEAVLNPTPGAVIEANRMVSEKASAAVVASLAAAKSGVAMTAHLTNYVSEEAAHLGQATEQLAQCRDPLQMASLQGKLVFAFLGRVAGHGLAMASLATEAGAATLEPYHSGVTANARRLAKPKA